MKISKYLRGRKKIKLKIKADKSTITQANCADKACHGVIICSLGAAEANTV